jgi:hypothetical protein
VRALLRDCGDLLNAPLRSASQNCARSNRRGAAVCGGVQRSAARGFLRREAAGRRATDSEQRGSNAGRVPGRLRNASTRKAPQADQSPAPSDASRCSGETVRASVPGRRLLAADIVAQPIWHGGSFKAGLLALARPAPKPWRQPAASCLHSQWPTDDRNLPRGSRGDQIFVAGRQKPANRFAARKEQSQQRKFAGTARAIEGDAPTVRRETVREFGQGSDGRSAA